MDKKMISSVRKNLLLVNIISFLLDCLVFAILNTNFATAKKPTVLCQIVAKGQ